MSFAARHGVSEYGPPHPYVRPTDDCFAGTIISRLFYCGKPVNRSFDTDPTAVVYDDRRELTFREAPSSDVTVRIDHNGRGRFDDELNVGKICSSFFAQGRGRFEIL